MRKIPFAGIELTSQRVRGYIVPLMNPFAMQGHQAKNKQNSFRVCVCVCVFSSHPFWTSSSLDVPAGVTQEEGHTGSYITKNRFIIIIYINNSAIDPCTVRAYHLEHKQCYNIAIIGNEKYIYILGRFLRGFFFKNYLGWRAKKILGKKNVS